MTEAGLNALWAGGTSAGRATRRSCARCATAAWRT